MTQPATCGLCGTAIIRAQTPTGRPLELDEQASTQWRLEDLRATHGVRKARATVVRRNHAETCVGSRPVKKEKR